MIQNLSTLQRRSYATETLANGLTVIHCHDRLAENAVAVMGVRVGSHQDPVDLPGLTHYLEHMLFLGTRDYPDEGHWKTQVAACGGGSNASTSPDHTVYHFYAPPGDFPALLPLWSRFFHQPTLDPAMAERELNAVHAEHQKNLQLEDRRESMLLRTLAREGSVFRRFLTGNRATLREGPESRGVDVLSRLAAHFTAHYVASRMVLSLVTPSPYDDSLRHLIHSLFSQITGAPEAIAPLFTPVFSQDSLFPPEILSLPSLPDSALSPSPLSPSRLAVPLFSSEDPPADPFQNASFSAGENTGFLVKITSVQPQHRLKLLWPCLPPSLALYPARPYDYLAHLIGHEGPGSLLAALKRAGLALKLVAGLSHSYRDLSVFSLRLRLTQLGMQSVPQVLSLAFSYLAAVASGPLSAHRAVFLELASLSATKFHHAEPALPVSHALSVCRHALSGVPSEHLLCAHSLFLCPFEAAWPHLSAALARLASPASAICFLASRDVQHGPPSEVLIEPIYSTQYSRHPMPHIDIQSNPSIHSSFSSISSSSASTIPLFHLPDPNPFLPSSFPRLLSPNLPSPTSRPLPSLSSFDANPSQGQGPPFTLSYWSLPDTLFGAYRSAYYLELASPAAWADAQHHASLQVLAALLTDLLAKEGYHALCCGYDYAVSHSRNGLVIRCEGFTGNIGALMHWIVDRMIHLDVQMFHRRFSDIKDLTVQRLRSHGLSDIVTLLDYHSREVRLNTFFRIPSLLEVLESLTSQQVHSFFINEFCPTFTAIALFHGGLAGAELVALQTKLLDALQQLRRPPQDETPQNSLLFNVDASPCFSVKALPYGCNFVLPITAKNAEERNSASLVLMELGEETPSSSGLALFFAQLVSARCFQVLRTQKQLGYRVYRGIKSFYGIQYFYICVQSSDYQAAHLDHEIEDFCVQLHEYLGKPDPVDFEKHKASLLQKLRKPFERKLSLSEHLWAELHRDRNCRFDFDLQIATQLDSITSQDILQFYTQYIQPLAPQRRRFAIHLRSPLSDPIVSDPSSSPIFILSESQLDLLKNEWLNHSLPPF